MNQAAGAPLNLGTRGCQQRTVHVKRCREPAIDNQSVDVALGTARGLERTSLEGSDAFGVAEQLSFATLPADVDVLLGNDVVANPSGHRLIVRKDS